MSSSSSSNYIEEFIITASDRSSQDEFGRSVSVIENYIIIGAPKDDDDGGNSGSVYFYRKNEFNIWGDEFKISDGVTSVQFGYSVDINGDYAVVGSLLSEKVYVYRRTGLNVWGDTEEISALDSSLTGDIAFGRSVSIYGDYIVVGAPEDNDKGTDSGAVYFFRRVDLNEWTQLQKICASDGAISDRFGASVAIDGDYAVVGSPEDYDDLINSGSVYIYRRIGFNAWGEEFKITPSDGQSGDKFGHSVSISGDYVIVGSPVESDNGSIYFYKRTGLNTWGEEFKAVAFDGNFADTFGHSVSINGDSAVTGSPVAGLGSIYVYKRLNDNNWSFEEKLSSYDGFSGDNLGYSVSLSNEVVASGAISYSGKGIDSGGVSVFNIDFVGIDSSSSSLDSSSSKTSSSSSIDSSSSSDSSNSLSSDSSSSLSSDSSSSLSSSSSSVDSSSSSSSHSSISSESSSSISSDSSSSISSDSSSSISSDSSSSISSDSSSSDSSSSISSDSSSSSSFSSSSSSSSSVDFCELQERLMPLMQNNYTPFPYHVYDGSNTSPTAYLAFDENINTRAINLIDSLNIYLGGAEALVTGYRLDCTGSFVDGANVPYSWTFQGSTNGVNWFDLDRQERVWDQSFNQKVICVEDIENLELYRYYRIRFDEALFFQTTPVKYAVKELKIFYSGLFLPEDSNSSESEIESDSDSDILHTKTTTTFSINRCFSLTGCTNFPGGPENDELCSYFNDLSVNNIPLIFGNNDVNCEVIATYRRISDDFDIIYLSKNYPGNVTNYFAKINIFVQDIPNRFYILPNMYNINGSVFLNNRPADQSYTVFI